MTKRSLDQLIIDLWPDTTPEQAQEIAIPIKARIAEEVHHALNDLIVSEYLEDGTA
jgi:hypothetical protein